MHEEQNCPSCNATGSKSGLIPDSKIELKSVCCLCKGSGKVPSEMLLWIAQGKKLREHRTTVLGMDLQTAAYLYGTTASHLSAAEQGLIDNFSFKLIQ